MIRNSKNEIFHRLQSRLDQFWEWFQRRKFSKNIPLSLEKPLLRVEGVKKSFSLPNREIPVLTRVDFQVAPKETIAITGASGSGKSTLLNILAGIDLPTQGDVYFYQYPLKELSENELAIMRSQFFGFVFQQHNLIKEMTVWENVLLSAMVHPLYSKMKKEKSLLAHELIAKIGLSDRLDHYVGELSGGEAQRVAIVRAFINGARLILADEPTGNLDSMNSQEVFSLLKNFSQIRSAAVIMVTHSQELASQCDRIYDIRNGILKKVR